MNTLIAAGGTGGHIYPAMAVAEALVAKGDSITWIGSNRGIEQRVVAPKYSLFIIDVKGYSGNIVQKLALPWYFVKAMAQCRRIFKETKPDVVFSTGGYVSLPVGFTAWFNRVPLVLHESNAKAGMSNKILSKLASKVLTSFDGVLASDKTERVGTPVRAEIDAFSPNYVAPNTMGVVGGSLGAQVLNEQIPLSCAEIPLVKRPDITHQSGKDKLLATKVAYERAVVDANVIEYIDDMLEFYKEMGLIICRAGALTVTELTHVGVPAIFVPYPYAAGDHQRINAERLVEAGAARMIEQKDMTPERVALEINTLMSDTTMRDTMSRNLLALAQKGVANTIASILENEAQVEASYA